MAVSYIDSASGDGTSVTIPTHQVGDLLLFMGFRDGSNSTPTVPVDLTSLETNTSNSAGSALAYKIADTTSETSGTWSNATEVTVAIYRGVDQVNPVGDSAVATGSGTIVTYPELSLVITDGTSWVSGMAAHRATDTDMAVNPSGMSNRLNLQQGADEVTVKDTNGGVASWSAQTASVGGSSSGWVGYTTEIRAAGSSSPSSSISPSASRSPSSSASSSLSPSSSISASSSPSASASDSDTPGISPSSSISASVSPSSSASASVSPSSSISASRSPSSSLSASISPSSSVSGSTSPSSSLSASVSPSASSSPSPSSSESPSISPSASVSASPSPGFEPPIDNIIATEQLDNISVEKQPSNNVIVEKIDSSVKVKKENTIDIQIVD